MIVDMARVMRHHVIIAHDDKEHAMYVPHTAVTLGDGTGEVQLPTKREVCPRCDGKGKHDAWEGGMTASEMDEQGPDFFDDYMSGVYDVQCSVCRGRNVIEVVDRERVSDPALLARYDEEVEEIMSSYAMQEAEMRYGA